MIKKLLLVVCASAAWLGAAPRLTYIKEFKGSTPAYSSITIERTGEAVYKEAVDDELPIKFKLEPSEADAVFQLADKLDRFSRPLESNLKVAFMGTKTFRFEDGGKAQEQKFNYSLDEDAKILLDWFERMVDSEQHLIRLERAVKYDRLGVNQALLLLHTAYDKNRLVACDQFLPMLDRVVKNDVFLHMARERANVIAEAIRAKKAPKAE